MVIVNNIGRIPPTSEVVGDYIWNRGFNLVLLDPEGQPSHFGKFRPASDLSLRRETVIRETLSSRPELSRIVPGARRASDGHVQLQLSRFLRGEHFEHTVARTPLSTWETTVRSILVAAELLAAGAAVAFPDLLADPGTVALADEAAPFLELLRGAGVPAQDLKRLTSVLEAAPALSRRLQHGDLWTSNVVRAEDSWWLLDYEQYGLVQVPLYDVLHLVRTSSERRFERARTGGFTWVDRMASGDPTSMACRRLLSWACARHGLTAAQVAGALVFYYVDLAGRFLSRGSPSIMWAPYVAELLRVAQLLNAGQRVERVLLADSAPAL